MSIKHIKSLQKDELLPINNLIDYVKSSNIVHSIIAFDHYPSESNPIINIGILTINTQGEIKSCIDFIKTEEDVPSAWLSTKQYNKSVIEQSLGWAQGWKSGLSYILQNQKLIFFAESDFEIFKSHFDKNIIIKYAPIFIKKEFEVQYPNKSAALNEISSYLQLSIDQLNLKSKLHNFARIFNILMQNDKNKIVSKNNDINNIKQSIVRLSINTNSPDEFFEEIEKIVPVKINYSNGRIIGYSIEYQGSTIKGSELSPSLSWSQIQNDRNWQSYKKL